MKEFKYNINGHDYAVTVEGIKNNIATVVVNGETYTVKMPEERNANNENGGKTFVPPLSDFKGEA